MLCIYLQALPCFPACSLTAHIWTHYVINFQLLLLLLFTGPLLCVWHGVSGHNKKARSWLLLIPAQLHLLLSLSGPFTPHSQLLFYPHHLLLNIYSLNLLISPRNLSPLLYINTEGKALSLWPKGLQQRQPRYIPFFIISWTLSHPKGKLKQFSQHSQ